jgi:Protein of unknown function (DUF1460)
MRKFSQLAVWGLAVSLIFGKVLTALSVSYADDLSLQNNSSHTQIDKQKIDSSQTEDERIFKNILQYASDRQLDRTDRGKIVREVARQFLGKPYQSGLLDSFNRETLIVSLQKFDCFSLVETVLAIASNIASQENNYQTFTNNLIEERYHNGKINGYCSRLHYFSAWLSENQLRGNLENITISLGGIKLDKKLNFMSNHRQSYHQLNIKNNNKNYRCILQMEANLKSLEINYIPQKSIKNIYSQLRSGDIIGITTSIDGLDVTHVGFVDRDRLGKVRFLHASPAGKVTIAADLSRYVSRVPKAIGIIVARPVNK